MPSIECANASTALVASRAGTVGSLVAPHVRNTPNALALLAPGRAPLTFAALADHIDSVVQTVAAAGFGSGSRIGIALPNGPECASALFAVMACAICVPFNPQSDADTFRFLCRRLRVDAIIVDAQTSPAIRRTANELGVPLVTLVPTPDAPAGTFALQCESMRLPVPIGRPNPDDIALVLHTSGTTGKPKAVPLTQRSQYQGTLNRTAMLALTPSDRGICVAPLFTATGIRRSILPPLAAGASVVCVPRFDADEMLNWLTTFEATFYSAGPVVHRALLEAIVRRGRAPVHVLRFIVSGSAPLPSELQQRIEDVFGVPLVQTYAMTECGSIAQNPLPPGIRRQGSVGKPTDVEVAIAGEDGGFLPRNSAGEIVVRGPLVFRGYENDPAANRMAFIGDWFRTGDLGYFDADGYLYISGRLKDIINRGGFKVPSAEVDDVLMRHPAVLEAATFGVHHPTLGEDVVSAVVLREDAAATPSRLRDFAFESLAAYKVPSRIVIVTDIPKTPLGKVRRRALGEALAPTLRTEYEAPQGHDESAVAALFADVLGLEATGRSDNFFALGGDSLRGAQLIARARAIFGCMLDVGSLFRRPTVAEFAAEIARVVRDPRSPSSPITALPRSAQRPRGLSSNE